MGKRVWKAIGYGRASELPRKTILRLVKETKRLLKKNDFVLTASGDTLVAGYREKNGSASVFVAKILREYERR